MTKWSDYFNILSVDIPNQDMFQYYWREYHLVVISTGDVIGKYKDKKYAKKQAKYKFRKITSRVEKILLGQLL